MNALLVSKVRRLRQQGFTLVELMIGIALGMLIVLALLTLLVNMNRNNTELARTNSLIENGRFSLQLLEADVSHAGFWGGYVPAFDDLSISTAPGSTPSAGTVTFPTALPDPCLAYASWDLAYKANLVGLAVQAYQIPGTGVSPVCTGVITNAQPNTDVLVVRHAAPCAAAAGAADADCQDTANNVFFQSSRCSTDANKWALTDSAAELVLKSGDCAADAAKYRLVSTIYWVRNWFISAGDGIPTLVRTRFQLTGGVLAHQGTETLIEGIERMRIQLGVDNTSKSGAALTTADFQSAVAWSPAGTKVLDTPANRGDGNADTYVSCADAGSPCADPFTLANTVAVRLDVLARASSKTPGHTDTKKYVLAGAEVGPFSDGYRRNVYSQVVRLTNVSMRREVP